MLLARESRSVHVMIGARPCKRLAYAQNDLPSFELIQIQFGRRDLHHPFKRSC